MKSLFSVSGILILFVFFSFNVQTHAQEDYAKQWKRIAYFEDNALPSAALEVCDSIFRDARNEGNLPQEMKALLRKIKFSADFEEDSYLNSALFLDSLAGISDGIEQALFYSILAEVRWRYLQRNAYRINTQTYRSDAGEQMQWWDRRTFAERINKEYLQSLEAASALQNVPVRDYAAVLDTGKGSEILRPTLYDLLAHRAISFLTSDDASYSHIGEARKLNTTPELLYDARSFTALEIDEKQGPLHAVFSIYQDILRFHSKDKEAYALVDADLERLQFAKNKLQIPERDSLYRKALTELQALYKNKPVYVDISYHLAQDYVESASKYNPPDETENRYDIKEAVSICNAAISAFPDAFHSPHCRQIVQRLLQASININHPEVNLPGEEFLGLITYKNTEKIHYRVIAADPNRYRQNVREKNTEELILHYLGERFTRDGEFTLDDEGDHQQHRIEVPFPALEKGFYVLLIMDGRIEDKNEVPLSEISSFWVSDISMLSKQQDDGSLQIMVSSRSSGEPLDNAIVSVYFRSFDYRSRTYRERPGPVTVTDSAGMARIMDDSKGTRNEQAFITIRYGDDYWQSGDRFYLWSRNITEKKRTLNTPIFTDRSVYRPGQTLYFKGILVSRNDQDYSVVPNEEIEVVLNDANGQRVAVAQLKTNDYGSFNASFTLPSSGLLGNYHLFTKHGGTNIKVEEYKRPRFEVSFKPVQGEYRLNDSIKVEGTARAYAGNMIGGAKIEYQVKRTVNLPWIPWDYYRIIPRPGKQELIASGEGITNPDGSFEISFLALPGQEGMELKQAVYSYTINATITDISGEVREASTTVRVGKTAFTLEMDIPDRVNKSQGHSYVIEARNPDGERVEANVRLELYRIKKSERLLRDRLWAVPDQLYLEKETYIDRFPMDPYDEDSRKNETEEEALRWYDLNTATDSLVNLNALTTVPEGPYLLKMTSTDKYGEEVKWEKAVEVYVQKEGEDVFNQILWAEISSDQAKPEEVVNLVLSTATPELRLMIEIFNTSGFQERRFEILKDEKKVLPIFIRNRDKGGMIIHCIAVYKNSIVEKRFDIAVPRTGIAMDYEIERFRDKLQVGEDEEWTIRFKGDDGAKVMPELLLGMYDASLDIIHPHSWNFQAWYSGPKASYWRPNDGFGLMNGRTYHPPVTSISLPYREYDHLDWQGLEFWSGYGRGPMMAFDAEMADGLSMKNYRGEPGEGGDELQAEMKLEGVSEIETLNKKQEESFIRRDLAETAFFLPNLYANQDGGISVKFTAPEAVTKWNLMGFAHTKDLRVAHIRKSLRTAKDLMVVPNLPRHLHQKDKVVLKCRISNTSDNMLSGTAELVILDVQNGRDLSQDFQLRVINDKFSAKSKEGSVVAWEVTVHENAPPLVQLVFKASAGNLADGEAHYLPVFSSKTLVTESKEIFLPGKGSKKVVFDAFKERYNSGSDIQKLSLEYTANPSWQALKALPYLMDNDQRSANAIFNRFFANSLANTIINSNEEIADVFRIWQEYQPEALWSELDKNQDLKTVVLNESPWVRQAGDEKASRQRIGQYFKEENILHSLNTEWKQLVKMQAPDGGWPWYPGMRSNRHITADIIAGMGFLMQSGAMEGSQDELEPMLKATRWLLDELVHQKKEIEKQGKQYVESYIPSSSIIKELYATRLWMDELQLGSIQSTAWKYFYDRAASNWAGYPLVVQALLGEIALPEEDRKLVDLILASFRDRALMGKDGALYWRDLVPGYRWYEEPIAGMAGMIRFFANSGAGNDEVNAMRTWLLRNKKFNHWGNSRATVLACQAFLLSGTNWISGKSEFTIKVGSEELQSSDPELALEAGSAYFRKDWSPGELQADMAEISIESENDHPSWGAAYLQYFEEMSTVRAHAEGLQIRRYLGKIVTDEQGEVLVPVNEGGKLQTGDRVRVRIEVESDRELDFVHLKDPRASLFEPADLQSGMRYRGGMSWYQSIGDASTEFFLEHLRKGTHVFEYDMFVSQEGEFSLGPASVQCHYAPSHSAHSEGVKVLSGGG